MFKMFSIDKNFKYDLNWLAYLKIDMVEVKK